MGGGHSWGCGLLNMETFLGENWGRAVLLFRTFTRPSHRGADGSGLWLPSALEAAFMLHLIGSSFSKPVCVLSCLFSSLLKEVWPDRLVLHDPEGSS